LAGQSIQDYPGHDARQCSVTVIWRDRTSGRPAPGESAVHKKGGLAGRHHTSVSKEVQPIIRRVRGWGSLFPSFCDRRSVRGRQRGQARMDAAGTGTSGSGILPETSSSGILPEISAVLFPSPANVAAAGRVRLWSALESVVFSWKRRNVHSATAGLVPADAMTGCQKRAWEGNGHHRPGAGGAMSFCSDEARSMGGRRRSGPKSLNNTMFTVRGTYPENTAPPAPGRWWRLRGRPIRWPSVTAPPARGRRWPAATARDCCVFCGRTTALG